MSTIRTFIKREPVLLIAAAAALVSCFFVPPDAEYIEYIDFRTLALLYCLMTVVSGLRQAGLFSHMAHLLCEKAANVRSMGLLLVLMCFFSSMLITNDVALLTFVPFAVVVLGMAQRSKELVLIVVLQTVAANLGSILTPVGNPQNLYLYSYYDFSFGSFLHLSFPVWLLSLILVSLACLLLPKAEISVFLGEEPGMDSRLLALYALLFVVCLLVVLRVLSWPVMLAVVIAILFFADRSTLLRSDFMLLLTFVAFFVFAGNLARIEAVDILLRRMLEGREYLTALLASQVISNVPAALLLSGFSSESAALLLGVNVGGLGTPIASLASLISMKLYAHTEDSHSGQFLLIFTVINVVLLLVLSLFLLIPGMGL